MRTGAPVYFDNLSETLTPAHVMASASLPPGFPPTEIDGEYYWDGGVVSNSPMQFVIDDRPRYTALVFQVDLWDANGEVPLFYFGVLLVTWAALSSVVWWRDMPLAEPLAQLEAHERAGGVA